MYTGRYPQVMFTNHIYHNKRYCNLLRKKALLSYILCHLNVLNVISKILLPFVSLRAPLNLHLIHRFLKAPVRISSLDIHNDNLHIMYCDTVCLLKSALILAVAAGTKLYNRLQRKMYSLTIGVVLYQEK